MVTCLVCEDTGWVCESHPDQPWKARMPALAAARTVARREGKPPRLPRGVT